MNGLCIIQSNYLLYNQVFFFLSRIYNLSGDVDMVEQYKSIQNEQNKKWWSLESHVELKDISS